MAMWVIAYDNVGLYSAGARGKEMLLSCWVFKF